VGGIYTRVLRLASIELQFFSFKGKIFTAPQLPKGTTMLEKTTISPKLLEILVCPITKTPLRYDSAAKELISEKAGLAFPIRDGIPIMLPEEARKLKDS
jgi:uncharacterized protein YbaR (Trm112 family)